MKLRFIVQILDRILVPVGAVLQFIPVPVVRYCSKIKEASISPEIPVTEVQKLWFVKPETSLDGSPTVRVALQELKTVTQLRFFKLR